MLTCTPRDAAGQFMSWHEVVADAEAAQAATDQAAFASRLAAAEETAMWTGAWRLFLGLAVGACVIGLIVLLVLWLLPEPSNDD